MKYLLLILFILMISNVYADCDQGQININTASKQELDSLYGIGPVKAEAIINSRSFESVDELIEVKGIGEITLQKIKDQGLACVDGISENKENTETINESLENVEEKTNDNPEEEIENFEIIDEEINKVEPENTELEVIKLNTQIIKGQENKEKLDDEKISGKNNYAIYGFVIFCIVLGVLFILKRNRFNKNEFR